MKDVVNLSFDLISKEEGFSTRPYRCPTGHLTIGYGINLETTPLPRDIAELWSKRVISFIVSLLERKIDFFSSLDPARKAVLVSIAYQIGVSGLLGFRRMLSHLKEGDYDGAATELGKSRLSEQTPERVKRHQEILRTGTL